MKCNHIGVAYGPHVLKSCKECLKMDHTVEKLEFTHREEILNVLKQAFATHPMLPPDTPIEKTQALMELILDSYSGTDRAYLFGIRSETQLVCVSFSGCFGSWVGGSPRIVFASSPIDRNTKPRIWT